MGHRTQALQLFTIQPTSPVCHLSGPQRHGTSGFLLPTHHRVGFKKQTHTLISNAPKFPFSTGRKRGKKSFPTSVKHSLNLRLSRNIHFLNYVSLSSSLHCVFKCLASGNHETALCYVSPASSRCHLSGMGRGPGT